MSRILLGSSKLFLWRYALRHKMSFRLFSSWVSTPYMMLGTALKKDLPDGSEIRDVFFFDPAKEELLTVPDKTFPEELVNSRQIGSSHGWGLFSNYHDRSLCMSDIYHPLASKSNPKMIPLPQFAHVPTHQPDLVSNLAISSSPSEEDCVVGIYFRGRRQLSLCRPHRDMSWTNTVVPSVASLLRMETANLMYSKRDQRFYLHLSGSNFLFSWDLNLENIEKPEFHELIFRDLDESELRMLNPCSRRSEHMVESASSGERFFVKWYLQGYFSSGHGKIEYTTRRFMVFREQETTENTTVMLYTEDIGDVCIFILNSAAFCIPASSSLGLKPNSIYFAGSAGFGIYNLAERRYRLFQALTPTSPDRSVFSFLKKKKYTVVCHPENKISVDIKEKLKKKRSERTKEEYEESFFFTDMIPGDVGDWEILPPPPPPTTN